MVASKVISTSKKHFQSLQKSHQYCFDCCYFDAFVLIYRHSIWLKESEAVVRRGSIKHLFFKIWQNLQESICAGISFSIKLQAGVQHLHQIGTSVQVL